HLLAAALEPLTRGLVHGLAEGGPAPCGGLTGRVHLLAVLAVEAAALAAAAAIRVRRRHRAGRDPRRELDLLALAGLPARRRGHRSRDRPALAGAGLALLPAALAARRRGARAAAALPLRHGLRTGAGGGGAGLLAQDPGRAGRTARRLLRAALGASPRSLAGPRPG